MLSVSAWYGQLHGQDHPSFLSTQEDALLHGPERPRLTRTCARAAPGAAPGNSLDDLLGGSAPSPGSHFLNNTIVAVEAPPGLAQNYASSGQQHSFDALQGASIGISAQPTVSLFSAPFQTQSREEA